MKNLRPGWPGTEELVRMVRSASGYGQGHPLDENHESSRSDKIDISTQLEYSAPDTNVVE
jgi:hypothetical protein